MPKYNYKPYLIDSFTGGLMTNWDDYRIPPGAYNQFQNFVNGRVVDASCKRYGIKDAGCGVPAIDFEKIQIAYFTLDKSGTKTGYMFVQLKGDTHNIDLYYIEYNLTTRTWGTWQPVVSTLAFTSGGTYQVKEGDVITGATSAATATVLQVTLTSGNWTAGSAAGNLFITQQSGIFVSENLNVGANNNVATISGNSTCTGNPVYGTCKADRLNFAIFRGALRIGAGNYADSYPLWIGYIDREKTTDKHGYFNNALGLEALYTCVAHIDEPDPNDLINSITVLQSVETEGRIGGSLLELGRYAFILTYEYDGYQEGNGKREKFYEYIVDSDDIIMAVSDSAWPHTLVGSIDIDLATLNMRLSAVNIYCGLIPFGVSIIPPVSQGSGYPGWVDFIIKGLGGGSGNTSEPTIRVTTATGESVQEVPFHLIQRLDINEDDEIVKLFGTAVDAGGGVGTVFRIEYKDPALNRCPWPSDVFDNFYIKYRKIGTSAWTKQAINTTLVTYLFNPDTGAATWRIDIAVTNSITADDYEIIIINRWETVLNASNDISGYRKYFIHNNLSIGNQYERRFGDCNFKRSTFVNDQQFACGIWSLADDENDLPQFEPMLLRFGEFDENGNPCPDKLSGFLYLKGDQDDETLVCIPYLWRKDYRVEDLFVFCKKSLHHIKFDDGGILSVVEQPYEIGLAAPDSLYYDGSGWYFIGRERNVLGIFYFNPSAGAPKRIDLGIADLLARADKSYLQYAIGWYDPLHREYRFELPEFAS